MQLTTLKIKATGVLVRLDNRHYARNLRSVYTRYSRSAFETNTDNRQNYLPRKAKLVSADKSPVTLVCRSKPEEKEQP